MSNRQIQEIHSYLYGRGVLDLSEKTMKSLLSILRFIEKNKSPSSRVRKILRKKTITDLDLCEIAKLHFSGFRLTEGKVITHQCGEGSYGTYYRISKTKGIKVISTDKSLHLTIKDLKSSLRWKLAKREFNLQKKASKLPFVSRPYKLIPIFLPETGSYYPAIIMDHIEGKSLISYKRMKRCVLNLGRKKIHFSNFHDLRESFRKELRSIHIKHGDIFERNVLIQKDKSVKLVDFGLAKIIK